MLRSFLFFRIETLSDEDGGGFLISYPNLAGCVSDGETTEEAMVNIPVRRSRGSGGD